MEKYLKYKAKYYFLKKGGADVNTQLINAAQNGHINVVQALVGTLGIDIHIANNDGNTALILAEQNVPINQEIVKLLRPDSASP